MHHAVIMPSAPAQPRGLGAGLQGRGDGACPCLNAMPPKNLRFGGGAGGTILHPLVAAWLLIAIVLILALPRKKAIVPFVLAFFSTPLGQLLVLGGVHVTMLQLLILTVLGRMAAFKGSASEKRFSGGFNSFDKLVVAWTLVALLAFSLEFMDIQAVIKGLGDLVVSLGGYLAVRFLIPDREAIRRTVKVLAVICVIQGVFMVSEQFTYQNFFSSMGANPPTIREGHVRSEGAMGNLWAGAFAGSSIPLFLWIWAEKNSRTAAYAGLAGATAMVFATHASTSWMTYGASLIGLGFWCLRKRMRFVRWGLVAILIALHLVMHGPVWSLIEKIDLTGGSSSYHRYMILDNCIRHFSDWWLLGCKTYGEWGFDMWDLCNQFVVNALTGGLLTLVLYLTIFKRSFRAIGLARKRVQGDRPQEWLVWCLGSALFANVVAHFGINYMTHLSTYFSILWVCISVTTFEVKQGAKRAVGQAHSEADPLAVEFAPSIAEKDACLSLRETRQGA